MIEERTGLLETLRMIEARANDDRIKFSDIVTVLQERGCGDLLVLPALLIVLPFGAIPGVPAIFSVIIFVLALQILLGVESPRLPRRLREASVNRSLLQKAMIGTHKAAMLLDRLSRPRLHFMTKGITRKCAMIFVMVLAVLSLFIGFVPFAPTILMIPVILLGLGLSGSDGLITLFGLLSSGATLGWVPFIL